MADLDGKALIAPGEFFYRNGANPAGMSPADLATLLVGQTAFGTSAALDVDIDPLFTANSNTRVPSQAAVLALVMAAGGDVSGSDTDASGWSFVSNDTTLVGDRATHLTTEHAVKGYVDGKKTVTTSDLAKVPVTTVGPVTIFDVDDLLTSADAEFLDGGLRIQNTGDPTKQLAFSLSGISAATTRTLTIPNVNGTVMLDASADSVTGLKTFVGGIRLTTSLPGFGAAHLSINGPNDYSARSNAIEIYGYQGTGQAASLGFIQAGGSSGAPTQTLSTQVLMQLGARGYTSSAVYSSGSSGLFRFVAAENITTSARGAYASMWVTPATTTTLTEALRVTADTVPAIVARGPLVVGAGSGLASPATGYGVESKSGGIGYGVGTGGTVTQATSRTTGVTLNKLNGRITLFNMAHTTGINQQFTVTNSEVGADDHVILGVVTGSDGYQINVGAIAAGSFEVFFRNSSGGTLTEAPVIGFAVIKGSIT